MKIQLFFHRHEHIYTVGPRNGWGKYLQASVPALTGDVISGKPAKGPHHHRGDTEMLQGKADIHTLSVGGVNRVISPVDQTRLHVRRTDIHINRRVKG